MSASRAPRNEVGFKFKGRQSFDIIKFDSYRFCVSDHIDIFGKKSANCDGDCPMCQKVKSSNASIIEIAGKILIKTFISL